MVLAQPDADPGRVGVTQVVQDAQGLLPGVLGAVLVTGGVADVAKVGEELGLIEAVSEFAHDVDGAKMAVDGFGEVAARWLVVLAEGLILIWAGAVWLRFRLRRRPGG